MDEDEYKVRHVLKATQKVDALRDAVKYDEWLKQSIMNKKLLTYKLQNIRQYFTAELNEKIWEYLNTED